MTTGGGALQQAAQSPCCRRRRGRSLQSLEPSAPQSPTSLSWSPMTHRKWKLRASRAVPSRSPSAVRYGMEKLSGSLPLRHMEWTIQSEMHSSSSTWRRKKRLGQRLRTGISQYPKPGIILSGGAILIGLRLHRLDSVWLSAVEKKTTALRVAKLKKKDPDAHARPLVKFRPDFCHNFYAFATTKKVLFH